MSIEHWLLTDWVPAIVLRGSHDRKFVCAADGSFCFVTTREHPILIDESEIEVALVEGDTMLVRSRA